MFENKVYPLLYQEDLDEYGHTILDSLQKHWVYVFMYAMFFLIVLVFIQMFEWIHGAI